MTETTGPHILVAAGDYDVIEQVSAALADTDYIMDVVYSHRDALYGLEQKAFDVVLVDAAMQDRNTGEATVTAFSRLLDRPIIALLRGGELPVLHQPPVEMVVANFDPYTLHNSLNAVLYRDRQPNGGQTGVEEIETLFALGRSLTEVLDLSEVLNRIVAAARTLTGAEEGMLLLPDDEAGRLYLRARVGIDDEVARNFRIKTEDSLAGQVFSTGEPALVGAQGLQKVKTQYFVKSLLYVPVLLKGKPIGVLGVNNKTAEEVFDRRQQELLMNLASYAAVAIENARIHEESLRRARELQSLVEASRVVNSSVALDRTLPNICEQLVRVLDVNWSAIYEWDRENNRLNALAHYQQTLWRAGQGAAIDLAERPGLKAALDEGRPLRVIRDGTNVFGESEQVRELAVHSMFTVPIIAENQILGIVRAFYIREPGQPITADMIQRAQRLGLECLMTVTDAASQSRVNQIFQLMQQIVENLESDWCELATLSPKAQTLNVQVTVGQGVWLNAPYPSFDLVKYPDLLASVANQIPFNQQANSPTLTAGARALLDMTHSRAVLGLPLVQRGQAQGLVVFSDVRGNRVFNEREIDMAWAIVGQAATALENARLFHDLERSLQELKDTQERMIQATRLSAMGELAAAVAHQINNPLTTILVDTELMLMDEPPDSRNYRSLEAISRAGKRAASVVRRLLATARPTEENGPVEPVDIVDTVEGILSLVRSHIAQDQVQLVTKLPDTPLPPVWAVQGQIDDIWLNLLLNAHDALAGRLGGKIGIEVYYRPERSYVDVVVWDNGPGIPEDIQAEIFRPFFTTKPVGEGTGLGLHICKQVVDRVGGSIKVDSAPNQGTRFLVRLPVRKGEE